MNRSEFFKSMILLSGTPLIHRVSELTRLAENLEASEKMPVFFVGHGNPMNAVLDNSITQGWTDSVNGVPRPQVILCISAHWETRGTWVTAMPQPKTIYDFYGFPQELYQVKYNAPGSPEYADLVTETVRSVEVGKDESWGLDHGTWSILTKMYPAAEIPVLQLSLNRSLTAAQHYWLAQELAPLREKGVLIVGSGNIVHNLRMADLRDDTPYQWAEEFDVLSKQLIEKHEHQKLVNYQDLGTAAQLSIPTPEHYLPMLYAVALHDGDEPLSFFNEELVFKSGSMRSFKIG